jgi:hypothetical protein
MTSYNVNTLIEAVNEYFYSEEELKRFLKTWVPGWWESKTPKQREDYTKYTERNNEKYNTVHMLCKLINIDLAALVAMVKGMKRYEKRTRWENCVHINYRIEENVKRFLAKGDRIEKYYTSTGRKKQYAI